MNQRITTVAGMLLAGLVFVGLLSVLLPEGEMAKFLLDKNPPSDEPDEMFRFPYPFTIQNIMWLVFFIGVGELVVRYMESDREIRQIHKGLLPEDETILLRKQDLVGPYKRMRETMTAGESYFLQRLMARCIQQFQISGDIDKANNLFNSSLELFQHEIELKYNALRYIVWLIPTLGFIGTVVGIAFALNYAGNANFQDEELLGQLTQSLGVAFYTTLLALLQAAVLTFVLHLVQGREEAALNRIGQYCLDNLINRLYGD